MAAPAVLQVGEVVKSAWQAGLGLSRKWCPHRRKRRKQLEEEGPKRGRGLRATPALLRWGCEQKSAC